MRPFILASSALLHRPQIAEGRSERADVGERDADAEQVLVADRAKTVSCELGKKATTLNIVVHANPEEIDLILFHIICGLQVQSDRARQIQVGGAAQVAGLTVLGKKRGAELAVVETGVDLQKVSLRYRPGKELVGNGLRVLTDLPLGQETIDDGQGKLVGAGHIVLGVELGNGIKVFYQGTITPDQLRLDDVLVPFRVPIVRSIEYAGKCRPPQINFNLVVLSIEGILDRSPGCIQPLRVAREAGGERSPHREKGPAGKRVGDGGQGIEPLILESILSKVPRKLRCLGPEAKQDGRGTDPRGP